jgi:hypothetical protein
MNAAVQTTRERNETSRYGYFINASRSACWEINPDVVLDRSFNFRQKFLPDGLSKVNELAFLTEAEGRALSRVQGRTYAFFFSLVERYIGATILDRSRGRYLPNEAARAAVAHFGDQDIKQQDHFRRAEALIASGMPGGYSTVVNPDEAARGVLAKSPWTALALACHIDLLVQVHYAHNIDHDVSLSPLFKNILRWHRQDACHLIPGEREWRRIDARLTPGERDVAVSELIELVEAVDRILRAQAALDSAYFLRLCDRNFTDEDQRAIRALLSKAYRWQYIVSGVQHPHFRQLLTELTTTAQMQRIQRALVPILNGAR